MRRVSATVARCNAAHSAQWQDLELIFRRLLQHGNMHKRREGVAHASLRQAETFMRVCLRPTEAACFHVRQCANTYQLNVVSIQRFLPQVCALRSSLPYRINLQNAVCAT